MSLSPSNLAGMGLTSSHLSQLVQISSLTGANQTQLTQLASKQAQFEQDYLRSYLGSAAPALASTAKPTPKATPKATPKPTPKPTPKAAPKTAPKTAPKVGTSSATQAKAKPSVAPVKQTAQFKAKQTTGGQAAVKKTVNKLLPPQGPHSSSLSSVAAMLSNTGVTLSKPAADRQADRTKESQAMAERFPYLNITPLSSSSKPLLSVKPNSQLLKPGAGGGNKTPANIAGGKVNPAANTPKAATSKAGPSDAKNKLALFKAQVQRTGMNVKSVCDGYFCR